MIAFHVPGVPQPQGSKRVVRGRLIDANARTLKPWRASVAAYAAEAMRRDGVQTATGPCAVTIHATFGRPKAHYRTNGELKDWAPSLVVTKPDIDKVVRACLDALTDAGVWRDDAQVARLSARKCYGTPGLHVEVVAL